MISYMISYLIVGWTGIFQCTLSMACLLIFVPPKIAQVLDQAIYCGIGVLQFVLLHYFNYVHYFHY